MAQQLGYHPDAFARSLRRRRSQTIGVLAYDLSDPYCIPVVRGIQEGLQPASYLPLLMDAQTQRALFDNVSADDSGAARRGRDRDCKLGVR